jgi:endonuclease YncB( thermonuclease family)
MKSPFSQVIRGKFVILGKQPDGDSVRFIADNPELYQYLHRAERIQPSKEDGSVQLRFQAIDAPELHYGSAAQPFGEESRDSLLKTMGFKKIQYNGNKVISAKPDAVPGAIICSAVERNGRPVSYVVLEKATADFEDGASVAITEDLLQHTLNYRLIAEGMAYPGFYSSMPVVHRRSMQTIARLARDQKLGIWELDQTSRFALDDLASISPPDGQLIYPKLFRRSVDYLKAVAKGFPGSIKEWLISTEGAASPENDGILLQGKTALKLSDLILQENSRVIFQADILDLVFLER